MSYSIDSLDGTAKTRYSGKLNLIGIDVCPYQLAQDAWIDKPTSWPNLEWPEVYDYLINSPGVFTRESMKSRKSLEAHNQFVCGWVRTVLCYTTPANIVILKAEVMPSQRLNEAPHIPWVAVNKDTANVIAAHCTCMAGLGESCSHIGALLYKVEAAVRCGYTNLTCTEEACKWNNDFVKKITPVPISKVRFYSAEAVNKFKGKPMTVDKKQPTEQKQEQFFSALSLLQGEKSIVLHTKSDYCKPFISTAIPPERARLPKPLRSFYRPEYASDTAKYREALTNIPEIKITESTNNYLNSITKKQYLSPIWHEMRSGRITASKVYLVLKTNQESPAPSLIKDICKASTTKTSFTNIPSLKWGIENEKVALEEYKLLLSNDHSDFTIHESGLKLCTSKAFIGASPDGLLTCKCHDIKQLIEVKCPFSLRDTLNSDNVPFLDEKKTLRADHSYFAQI